MSKKIVFLFLIVGVFSCSIKKPFQQAILKEASELHQEAQKMGDQASSLLEELIQQANSIQVQGRALTRSELAFVEQVNQLRGELQNWEYGEPKLPSTDFIRIKDKEKLMEEQTTWKKWIEDIFEKIKQI